MRRETRERMVLAGTAVALCLMGSAPGSSNDGRIPIYQPTVIGQDGTYYVTNDITAAGTILEILPTATWVSIDLNGNRLTRTDPGEVIRAEGAPSSFTRKAEVYNGILWTQDMPAAGTKTVKFGSWNDARVSDVETNGIIEFFESDTVKMSNTVAASATVTGTTTDHVTGSFRNLTFVDAFAIGLDILNGSAIQVENTVVENPASHGVRVNNCDACQFDSISVQDSGGNSIRVEDTRGSQWRQISSIRSQDSGIFVDLFSQGNTFADVTASFSQNGNPGMRNDGSQTGVSKGHFHGNSGGGVLNMGSEFNIWDIMTRGNAPPNFDDQGFLTFDGGGNVFN